VRLLRSCVVPLFTAFVIGRVTLFRGTSEVIVQRRCDVAGTTLQPNRLEQAAQVASRPLIQIEIGGIRLAGERKFDLEPFELDRQNTGAADDRALSRARGVKAAKVGDVLMDEVPRAPDPWRTTINTGQQC
jgi:hypothetical protein